VWLVKEDALNADPIVIEIWKDAEQVAGPGLCTSAHRPYIIGDRPSVHNLLPTRGLDRRCRIEKVGIGIRDYINSRWQYDPRRPSKKCCIYHETKDENGQSKGFHLHFQGHPRTVRK